MKLHHLRSVREIARCGLSVTRAARRLNATQPGLTRHVQQLEAELGLSLFARQRNRLVGLTPAGDALLPVIGRAVEAAEEVRRAARDLAGAEAGSLSIACSPTHARYLLPPVVARFIACHPTVRLHLRQGHAGQTTEWLRNGEVDLAISTAAPGAAEGLVQVPCATLRWVALVPDGHALARAGRATLGTIARHPLITYDTSFASRRIIDRAFEAAGVEPTVVMAAGDSDVMKTYVLAGLGIALVAHPAFDPARDSGLVALPLGDAIPPVTLQLGLRRPGFLGRAARGFIAMLAPDALARLEGGE